MSFFSLFSRSKRKGLSARPAPVRRPRRLQLEALEDRLVLSTLFLVDNNTPVDATHFHRFQDAYQGAAAGDTIQIEPGAAVSSVGAGVAGNRLDGGKVASKTITIDNPNIGTGEYVTVTGSLPQFDESGVVTDVQANPNGTYTLTLNAKFSFDHTGAGVVVTTQGQLGLVKPITLQGDPLVAGLGEVTSDIQMPVNSHDLTFARLEFTSNHKLYFEGGAHHNKVLDCTVSFLTEATGTGNGDNVYNDDTLICAVINGDPGKAGNDQITSNHFHGSGGGVGVGSLYVENNNDAVIQGNDFEVTQPDSDPFTAITVINSRGLTIRANPVQIFNANNAAFGLVIYSSKAFPGEMSVLVEGNTFETGGKGIGMAIGRGDKASPLSVKCQGNYFLNNSVGVSISGDGTSVGIIDLGGGSLGSIGMNHFEDFTPAAAQAGHFAISLQDTNGQQKVYALGNYWGKFDPASVIRDGQRNTAVPEDVAGMPVNGSGFIVVEVGLKPFPGGVSKDPPGPPGVVHNPLVAVDPLSVALPGNVYGHLHLPDPPPIDTGDALTVHQPAGPHLTELVPASAQGSARDAVFSDHFGAFSLDGLVADVALASLNERVR
jgi:hypothetical protein